jgi:hypothetical protein
MKKTKKRMSILLQGRDVQEHLENVPGIDLNPSFDLHPESAPELDPLRQQTPIELDPLQGSHGELRVAPMRFQPHPAPCERLQSEELEEQ